MITVHNNHQDNTKIVPPYHNRALIEVLIVLAALAITFYAGYSLGHDHGKDDQPTHTVTIIHTLGKSNRVLVSTSTQPKQAANRIQTGPN